MIKRITLRPITPLDLEPLLEALIYQKQEMERMGKQIKNKKENMERLKQSLFSMLAIFGVFASEIYLAVYLSSLDANWAIKATKIIMFLIMAGTVSLLIFSVGLLIKDSVEWENARAKGDEYE